MDNKIQHSIHLRERTLSSYMVALSMKSRSTQRLFQCTLNNLNSFGKIHVSELSRYDEDSIYNVLQEWILWNDRRGVTASTITCYFNSFRAYLWYIRIKLDWRDVKQNLIFPKMRYDVSMPVRYTDIQNILQVSKLEFRFQILALVSSGLRINELGQIQLSHLDLSRTNAIVHIPALVSKTGRSRISFFSTQVSDMIRYRRSSKLLKRTDHVFCGNRTPEQAVNLVIKRFAASRRRADMMEKRSHCKQIRYKIHLHNLRSYFITKANRVQFGLGHVLAGHGFYMKEYNLYSIEELYDMYKKAEDLFTFRNMMQPQ